MYICLTDLVDNYFCALSHPVILYTVLNIVSEHIPTLEALNLESNKLQNFGKLMILNRKFSKLKILHIGDNKVSIAKLYIVRFYSVLSFIFLFIFLHI